MPIGPGTKLGQYVVQDAIGEGAMGVVYRAYHPQLERTGAVKVLHALGPDPDTTARFRREAQAIAHMRHPNVLNVFDFGEYEGTPYMIVEYVPGGNLTAKVKGGPMDTTAALAYLRGIGAALDYAHSHGIVHRDVKPANVLLGPDETPILADFGLAKLMESSSIKSLTGVTTGTPAYMAPEQVTGSQLGPAADRYSLAVMAYEMLTGSLPFQDGGVLEVLYAQVHRQPAPPSALNRKFGPRVDAVIMRGLSKQPEARWDRCSSFVAALEAALRDPVAAVERTVAVAPPLPAAAVAQKKGSAVVEATTAIADDQAPGAIRGPDPALPHPVITRRGFVVPKPAKPHKRRRARTYVLLTALILLVLLLTLGTCAVLTAAGPSMSLSRYTVSPDEFVTVKAIHLPNRQAGEIQLRSAFYTFRFDADSTGSFTRDILVPAEINLGNHVVSVCWNGTCHLQTTLHVVASVALLPPDGGSPTPGSSPGSSPTPGSTPRATPRATPTPHGGSTPPPTPTPTPRPTPTPPNPCPTPSRQANLSGPGTVTSGQSFTVTGTYFTPNKSVIITYTDNGRSTSQATTVACDGSFSVTFGSASILVGSRTDSVSASDTGSPGRAAGYNFTLKAVVL